MVPEVAKHCSMTLLLKICLTPPPDTGEAELHFGDALRNQIKDGIHDIFDNKKGDRHDHFMCDVPDQLLTQEGAKILISPPFTLSS